MKARVLSLVFVFCIAFTAHAQMYEKKMAETLQMFGEAQNLNDYQKVANQFKMISNVANTEWLPLYYHAHIHILMSFMDNSSAAKKDEYLADAEVSLKKMLKLVPNEVEALALQAFYYTGKLVVDPMVRGMEYGMLFGQVITKAASIDPDNPRVRYLKLANDVGSAPFFGKDPKVFLPDVQKLLEEWDNYKLKSPLHPRWGKEQVRTTIQQLSK